MNNTEVKEKKKSIFKLTIGILSLAVLILGAAYAYWSASTMVNFNTAFISYDTGGVATVVLDGTSAILRMDIVGSDMNKGSKNKVFYASTDGKKTEPTEEVIGIAYPLVNSIRSYKCNFTLNLSHTGQNDLIEKFLGETNDEPNYPNRSAGQIILTVNGVEYDLNDGFPSTISGYIITDSITNGTINVGMKFVNLKNVDQTDLANTDGIINIDVANNGFTCETVDGRALYWAYEGKTTTSATAQNKVDDYHKLHLDSGAILYADILPIGGQFATLAECNATLSTTDFNNPEIQNQRCELATTDDYVLIMEASSFDTEAECLETTNNTFSCEYDSNEEKWKPNLEGENSLDYESQQDCERIRTVMESYMQASGFSFVTLSCSHPNSNHYYIKADLVHPVDDLTKCNDILTALVEFDDINDLQGNQILVDTHLGELLLTGSNYRCESPQQNVFVKETIGLKEINASNNVWSVKSPGYEPYATLSACEADLNPMIEWYSNNGKSINAKCVVNQPYTIQLDNVHERIFYDTLSECQSALTEYSDYDNARCVKNSLTDYTAIWYMDISFSTESECNDYISSNYYTNAYCEYNDDDSMWYLFDPSLGIMEPTELDCNTALSRAKFKTCDNSNGTCAFCDHPLVEKYYIYYDNGDNNRSYLTLNFCNEALEYYSESHNPTCVSTSNYKLYIDDYILGAYDTQSECENSFTNFQDEPALKDVALDDADNIRCIKNELTDYIIEYKTSSEFSSESDCNSYLSTQPEDETSFTYCKYDSSESKWYVYVMYYNTLTSTLADCQERLNLDLDSSGICVHPTFEKYFLYVDNLHYYHSDISNPNSYYNNYFISEFDCERVENRYGGRCERVTDYVLETESDSFKFGEKTTISNSFSSEEECNDFMEYANDHPTLVPIGSNPISVLPMNAVCKLKYENGTMIYDNTSEICGIIDGNALCYAPEGITDSNLESTLGSYSNYFDCRFNNGTLTCINDDYQAEFTSKENYYSSYLLDRNNSIGCGYDGNYISCFERVLPFTIESEHNPYPDNMDNKVYLERTFEGATSIEVQLTYQTESYYDDYITIYSGKNVYFGDYSSSSYTTTSFTIPSNYIRIEFYSDYNYNNYYGFSATITPIYD